MERNQKHLIGWSFFLILTAVFLLGKMNDFEKEKEALINSTVDSSQPVREHRTLAEVVDQVLAEFEVDKDTVAIVYQPFQTGDAYLLNEDKIMNAASTTKVAIAMCCTPI